MLDTHICIVTSVVEEHGVDLEKTTDPQQRAGVVGFALECGEHLCCVDHVHLAVLRGVWEAVVPLERLYGIGLEVPDNKNGENVGGC